MSEIEKKDIKTRIESMSKILLMPSCDPTLKESLRSEILNLKEKLYGS